MKRHHQPRSLAVLAALLLLGAADGREKTDEKPTEQPTASSAAALDERYQKWLTSVDLLMSDAEREVFLGLSQSYQRDEFIRRFWAVRDPFPQTTRNELRDTWEERVNLALQRFDELTSDRAHALLQFGPPSEQRPVSCHEVLRPLEVWVYREGSDRISGYFTLIFVGIQAAGRGPHHLWQPVEGLLPLVGPGLLAGQSEGQAAGEIRRRCFRGDDLVADLAQALDISRIERQTSLLPRPSDEWVRTFAARSTEVSDGTPELSAQLHLSYPGRNQSRTVVQGFVSVAAGAAEPITVGPSTVYRFLVDGEILRQGELFDRFRYQFGFPAEEVATGEIPLVVQRFLRPGPYTWILKVEDLGSKRVFREERTIEVPRVDPAELLAASIEAAPVATPDAPQDAVPRADLPAVPRPLDDRLAEANAAISTGDHVIKILPPSEQLQVGKLRIEARTQGEAIARVGFELDDRPVMKKAKPPYSIEIDLGAKPRMHTVRAIAYDEQGRTLATDEIQLNAGPHRFALRLIEPQQGRQYRSSVRVHAEVEVPEAERLEKVELYLNETLQTTLFQPPFEHPILLPQGQEVTYVRAVAYLQDGNSAEDVVFINAPDFVDEIKVQFVELFTSVLDRRGKYVEGLAAEDFAVSEDGIAQQVRRFETVKDLPIHAGIVIDTSLSMFEELPEVERAAYRFLETVLTPRDRAAVITFSDEPRLAVRFTGDRGVLAGGLAGLVAEGETALYDTLIFSLHYFSGLRGKRAIVLLTDGEDSKSTYTYDDVIEYARRTGVAVYVIGLGFNSGLHEVRVKMDRLARETGGESFYVDRSSQLGDTYEQIQLELRSQYLLAYQSSQGGTSDAFRQVEVKMKRKELEAKTMRGYFP